MKPNILMSRVHMTGVPGVQITGVFGIRGIHAGSMPMVFVPRTFAPIIPVPGTRTYSGQMVPFPQAMGPTKNMTSAIGVLCGDHTDELDGKQDHCKE